MCPNLFFLGGGGLGGGRGGGLTQPPITPHTPSGAVLLNRALGMGLRFARSCRSAVSPDVPDRRASAAMRTPSMGLNVVSEISVSESSCTTSSMRMCRSSRLHTRRARPRRARAGARAAGPRSPVPKGQAGGVKSNRKKCGKMRKNCGALTKPPEASNCTSSAQGTQGTNTHGKGDKQKAIAEKLRDIAKLRGIANNCGPQSPPPPTPGEKRTERALVLLSYALSAESQGGSDAVA